MADDNDTPTDPFEGFGAGPQGYGGGSAAEAPQGNAIPDDTEQPAYGESLGQDVSNIGQQIGQNISEGPAAQIGKAIYGAGQTIGQGVGAAADAVPRIVNYLSGGGSMSKEQWEQLNQQVDPNNTMDQNERTLRAIDTAQQQSPQLGAAAIQTARKHYDLYRAGAAKSLMENDLPNAVAQANHAFDYVPDGTKAQFTADKKGIISASIHTMDGQTQKYNLSADQFHQLLRGQTSMFDHVVAQGAGAITDAVAKAGGQGVQSPRAEDFIGGANPTKPVIASDLPPGGKQIQGPDGKTYTVPQGGKTVTDSEGRIHILGPGQEYNEQAGGAYTEPKGQVVDHTQGPEDQITMVRGGNQSLVGNTRATEGNSPEDIQAAKEQFPNAPGAQAAWLAGQRQQARNLASRVEVAKNTRLYGSQAVAKGRVEQEGVRQQGNQAVAGIKAGAQEYAADSRQAFEQYKVDHPKDATTSLYQTQINAMEKQAALHPEWTQDQMDEWLTQKFGRKNWSNVRPPIDVRGPTPQQPAQANGRAAPASAAQPAPSGNAGTPAKNTEEIRTDGKGNFYKLGPDGRPVLVQGPAAMPGGQ